jgi:exodeoxyribonuclease I
MSLVFYDTETTGTATFFDQILQFAAIKTDEDLKELDRFEIRSRLLPHVVPAPGAVSITGVKVSQLMDDSFPSHYEMVRAITSKLQSWSPSLFLGWNTMKFDEDLVRQALYKTLHRPYMTNTGGNTRSDVMRIVQACSLFAPDVLVFPTDADGQKIFKLDQIAPANGFDHENAHDALGDVQATIFMCRLVIERAPHVWSSFMRFSKKASVIDYINAEPLFCLSEFYFGRPYSYIVSVIGVNAENDSEFYVYDLNVDPQSISGLSDAELSVRVQQTPKPVRKLRCNTAPMLFAADDAPDCCMARELGMEELTYRAESLKADEELCKRLIVLIESQTKDYPTSPHVEMQIYDGFFEINDQELMDAFHDAPWPDRVAIVEKFRDQRLRTIGRQLIHLERPDLVEVNLRREMDRAIARRLLGVGEDIPWLTIPAALLEIQARSKGLVGPELEHLREHELHLRSCHERAQRLLDSD